MNELIKELIQREIIIFFIFNTIYLILELSFNNKCYIKDRQKIMNLFMS